MNADNTEITCVSLCSGYEGLGLGIKRVIPNLRVVLYSEIEIYADEVLVERMEAGEIDVAPIWTDLKTLRGRDFFGKVDVVTAGYPCQPFSAAGKRKGSEDERHLWPHIKRIIEEIEPRWVFFENVEGHLSLGATEVLADLESLGYRVEAGIFSAAEVGAPHQRKRVFILGYADKPRLEGRDGGSLQERINEQITRSGGASVGYSASDDERRLPVSAMHGERIETGRSSGDRWPARPGQEQFEWEEPRVC